MFNPLLGSQVGKVPRGLGVNTLNIFLNCAEIPNSLKFRAEITQRLNQLNCLRVRVKLFSSIEIYTLIILCQQRKHGFLIMAKLNAGLFIASGTEHAGAPLKISHQRCFKLRMNQKVSRVTPGVTSE